MSRSGIKLHYPHFALPKQAQPRAPPLSKIAQRRRMKWCPVAGKLRAYAVTTPTRCVCPS